MPFKNSEAFGIWRSVDDTVPDEEVEIEDENISIEYLMQIIQELPDQYTAWFSVSTYLDGYSHKEVAEMLKISPLGTTKVQSRQSSERF